MITIGKVRTYLQSLGFAPELATSVVTLVMRPDTGLITIMDWNESLVPRPSDTVWAEMLEYDPVPQKVTKRQLRLALLDDGHSPSDVETLILAAFPEGSIERAKALVEWQDALSYEREHPLVLALAPALGYDTGDKIDDVYRRAATYS